MVRTYNSGRPSPTIVDFGFGTPNSVALDAAGKIYLADNSARTLTIFNADGSPATPHITTGLNIPQDVVVDAAGKIYVLNVGNHTVTTYKPDGSRTAPTITLPSGSYFSGLAVH